MHLANPTSMKMESLHLHMKLIKRPKVLDVHRSTHLHSTITSSGSQRPYAFQIQLLFQFSFQMWLFVGVMRLLLCTQLFRNKPKKKKQRKKKNENRTHASCIDHDLDDISFLRFQIDYFHFCFFFFSFFHHTEMCVLILPSKRKHVASACSIFK